MEFVKASLKFHLQWPFATNWFVWCLLAKYCLKYTKISLILYIFHLPNCSVKLGLMWIEVWFYRYIVNNDRFRDEGCMLLMKTLLKSVTFSSSILFWFEALIFMSLNDVHFFLPLDISFSACKVYKFVCFEDFHCVYLLKRRKGERERERLCILILLPFALESSLFFSYVHLVGEHAVSETWISAFKVC